MDNSGKNRYELLFADDDVMDSLDNEIKQHVKQPAAVVPSVGTHQTKIGVTGKQGGDHQKKGAAQLLSSEKENKALPINKNLDTKKNGGNKAISGDSGGGSNGPSSKTSNSGQQQQQFNNKHQNTNPSKRDNNTTGVFKPQNNETREQRNNRRNHDDGAGVPVSGGYYNDDLQQQPRIRQTNQRFNRSGAEGVRGGKREFDRQSGSDKTGVKAVDKRDGAGARNWGSLKQDIEDITKSTDEVGLTDKEESGNDQSAEQNTTVEEETIELTLDEWKAQRQQWTKPQFNIRKAGEGEDITQWKQMIVLSNKKKDGDSEDEFEYDPSMYPQRVGRLQRVLDIQFHFKDGRRGGGGIGRGRGRGPRTPGGAERPVGGSRGSNEGRPRNENRREAGDERQQRADQNAPKVDDERQFPTLS